MPAPPQVLHAMPLPFASSCRRKASSLPAPKLPLSPPMRTVPSARAATPLADALRQDDTAAYVNFLGDEGEERIRAAYPGDTWDRLVDVKRRYDPTNLFRLNQNIPPG